MQPIPRRPRGGLRRPKPECFLDFESACRARAAAGVRLAPLIKNRPPGASTQEKRSKRGGLSGWAHHQVQVHLARAGDPHLVWIEPSVRRGSGADGVGTWVQVTGECTARADAEPDIWLAWLREDHEHGDDRRVTRLARWARRRGLRIDGPANVHRRIAGRISRACGH